VAALVSLLAANCWSQTFQSIHSFPINGSEGTAPTATLTVGPDGSLYGTASAGGANNAGTAFRIGINGSFAPLGSFVPADTGKSPVARMINIGDGFLYGVTSDGTGTAGDPLGTVFKLDPAGGLTCHFRNPGGDVTPKRPHALVSGEPNVLHVLGSSPGGIWRVPLDGSTRTAVFTITNSDDGIFPGEHHPRLRWISSTASRTARHLSIPPQDGREPSSRSHRTAPVSSRSTIAISRPVSLHLAPWSKDPDGTFYGTMTAGGDNSDGVIFQLAFNGVGFVYSVLHSINDHSPTGDLLLASDGKLYGTSRTGGNGLYGSIFRINTDGSGFQVIHSFNKNNGAYPRRTRPGVRWESLRRHHRGRHGQQGNDLPNRPEPPDA
jgi:uncharacterized repeat protein (TIGR03803 family)